ncbi:response regulator [Actinospongicola halichondriae]|uniref:response regulator n=1 Tax=Actinospongicola halichondriae TaxID=3236844 RepID=UPI003D3CA8BD
MNTIDGIEVVVADDEADIRLLLKLQLRQFGISVVGEAEDGVQAIEVCEAMKPHVVILDLLMPNMNGFEAIPELRRRCPNVKIIAYSAVAGDFVRNEMARQDVPLRLKNGDAEPLVSAIRAVVSEPCSD